MPMRSKPLKEKRGKSVSKSKMKYGIVALVFTVVGILVFSQLYLGNQSSENSVDKPKAALIDHLGFSSPPPNQTFNERCRTILRTAGFSYIYHDGHEVTVDFYRNLPAYDYGLILLRVHSAVIKDQQGKPTNLVGLFTSELWNETTASKYSSEIGQGKLAKARLFKEKDDWYFGITPLFVQSSMVGRFENAIIIMMGCEGLNHTSMAEYFRQRGAGAYISWTGLVSISHTDHATIRLLQSLLEDNQTIKSAVQETDSDPTWEWSELDYYPKGDDDIGNYHISHFVNSLTLNVAAVLPTSELQSTLSDVTPSTRLSTSCTSLKQRDKADLTGYPQQDSDFSGF